MIVTIKTWEELLKTPNIRIHGRGIYHNNGFLGFVKSMDHLCGTTVEIDEDRSIIEGDDAGYKIEEWMTISKSRQFTRLYEKLLR